MSTQAVHVRISGRVQGVWFRGWTAQEAQRLGLSGWVRNRKDGSVEAVFCGEAAHVDEICQLCHEGPRLAVVSSVEMKEAVPPDSPHFETRPTE